MIFAKWVQGLEGAQDAISLRKEVFCGEQGFDPDWIERQLAHKEKDTSRIAYNYAQYLPHRHRMMQAWADYLDSLRKETQKNNEMQ